MSDEPPAGAKATNGAGAESTAGTVTEHTTGIAAEDTEPISGTASAGGDGAARIYIGNDDHTDYFWSGGEADYRDAYCRMIEYYLDRADATENDPDDFQARFNCDGSLWLREYERNRPGDFPRLIRRIRDGHVSAPLTPLTICYGAMPAEAVLRSMFYAGRIERRHGLRFLTVQPMEDQTMPYGVGSLFAGAGARYAWMGICNCATRIRGLDRPRPHEIYWWTGRDPSRRILLKWNSLVNRQSIVNQGMGGYAEAFDPDASIDFLHGDPEFNARWPYSLVKAAFGKGWDNLLTLTDEIETAARSKSTSRLRVRSSNLIDFFRDFETTYGTRTPSFGASFGNEWDLYTASAAELSARVKRSVEKLRAAEAMAVLCGLADRSFMAGREEAREEAFLSMGLYFNHDWTADRDEHWRTELLRWARERVAKIEGYVDALHRDAARSLGRRIVRGGAYPRFFACNPLGWNRAAAVDFPYDGPFPAHAIDLATGREAPSQPMTVGGRSVLRVMASGVPSIGYKVYEIRPGKGRSLPPAARLVGEKSNDESVRSNDKSVKSRINGSGQSLAVENGWIRVVVNGRGAITSLLDRRRGGRELAREIDGRFMNDMGGEDPGSVEVESSGPVSVTLKASAARPLPHVTRVTMFRGSDRVEIENEITSSFDAPDDRFRWTFGFNLESPDLRHEEVGAVLRARLLPDGGHYAPSHARYDWLTFGHFADITGAGSVGVTLANTDCLFFKAGRSTVESLDVETPQISALIGGRVDGPGLGIPAQGGDRNFRQRFALRTHGAVDEAVAMRFGMEFANPLVVGPVTGEEPLFPAAMFRLLRFAEESAPSAESTEREESRLSPPEGRRERDDGPRVLSWSVKPAEDGIDVAGIALRVWNLSGETVPLRVTMGGRWRIASARTATHVETPTGDAGVSGGALRASVPPHALETYLLRPRERANQ